MIYLCKDPSGVPLAYQLGDINGYPWTLSFQLVEELWILLNTLMPRQKTTLDFSQELIDQPVNDVSLIVANCMFKSKHYLYQHQYIYTIMSIYIICK